MFRKGFTVKKFTTAVYNNIKAFDVLIISICLSLFGVIMLYSMSISELISINTLIPQLIAFSLGVICAVILLFIDYRKIIKLWYIFAPLGILFVLAVYIPGLGYTPVGSDDTAWIVLGPLSVQPSELLKLVFIITFTYHLNKVKNKINELYTFLTLCAHALLPFIIIMAQGDMGTAVIFIGIFFVMMYSAGLSRKFFLVLIASVVAAAPFVWYLVLPDYLKERFYIALNPSSDPMGIGYQQYLGIKALQNGGLFGVGIRAEYYVEVPKAYNDFIFSYVVQCTGVIGAILLIALITLLCIRLLITAKNCSNFSGTLICSGVFAIIFLQSVINIGMVVCLLPVIGITLPFLSSGGTSLLTSFIGIGLVMSVKHQHNMK